MSDVQQPRSRVLQRGPLCFTARTMGAGQPVLLLHGFPDSEHSFDAQLPALAAAGYRAIAVRLRGYETASQPRDADYHAASLAEDVLAWLDALGEANVVGDGRVHLIGHDWGAIVAQAAVAMAPERFASLSLLAVPRYAPFGRIVRSDRAQLRRSLYTLFFQWRGVADWYVRRNDCAALERLWRHWSPGWDVSAETLATMKAVFREPGVVHAALSYYRQARERDSAVARRSASLLRKPLPVRTLGLCGAHDGCITADVFRRAMPPGDFPAGLRIEEVADAGHFLHQEQPAAVNRLLLEWLGGAAAIGP